MKTHVLKTYSHFSPSRCTAYNQGIKTDTGSQKSAFTREGHSGDSGSPLQEGTFSPKNVEPRCLSRHYSVSNALFSNGCVFLITENVSQPEVRLFLEFPALGT